MNRIQIIIRIIKRIEQGGVRSKTQLEKENIINKNSHPLFDVLRDKGIIVEIDRGLGINNEKASEYKLMLQELG